MTSLPIVDKSQTGFSLCQMKFDFTNFRQPQQSYRSQIKMSQRSILQTLSGAVSLLTGGKRNTNGLFGKRGATHHSDGGSIYLRFMFKADAVESWIRYNKPHVTSEDFGNDTKSVRILIKEHAQFTKKLIAYETYGTYPS